MLFISSCSGIRKLVPHTQPPRPHIRTIRRILVSLLGLTFSSLFLLWITGLKVHIYPKGFLDVFRYGDKDKIITGSPPDWSWLYAHEDGLPQHNLDLPFPEGRTGRYVRFSNEIRQLGWNNVFNEVLMNTHLARASNRAYVFQDYHWKDSYYPWPIPPITFSPSRRHPRTPLSALISGPSAGGPWEPDDPSPRSVSVRYWDIVCPQKERKYIYTNEVKPLIPKPTKDSLSRSRYGYAGGPVGENQRQNWESPWGDEIFKYWKDLLLNSPERCVEILPGGLKDGEGEDPYPQTFDVRMWATQKVLPLWESFSVSPVSKLLKASPTVKSGVDRNLHLFQVRGSSSEPMVGDSKRVDEDQDPLSSVLAIHVRLGDFSDACTDLLAAYNLTFYSWNLLPFLSQEDVFIPPPGGVPSPSPNEEYVYGKNTPENVSVYLDRCQPSIGRTVEKVHSVRQSLEADNLLRLHTVYILTNSSPSQLRLLRNELQREGWENIVTSRDLVLDDYQRDVGPAVDAEIARRARGFIGNGWSSMTSNIVHQRLVTGHEPKSIRFW
ncbi:hypothetical protein E1B28_012774 [Marasmius oreades]|uniref:Uncharacterized protein n=1 Tax=Marasmius oreades TaxID=181124 RepID=A0A9P7RSA5_9AGAR|nr:uncharacterized protein E1B28_012774 [Marasmius oreades]KAG7088814.1 hypothetical protein E1B28_012774 [Marasmius oreades]